MKNKFHDNQNRLITRNLFKETSARKEQVLYSFSREDVDTIPSLYKLYMAEADLTEFDFARKYFDSYQHWKRICQTSWFHPHIVEWREELELSIRSKALSSLIKRSESSTEIAKYLLNNNWVSKIHENNPSVNLRGRPSKEEIKGHLTLITNTQIKEQSDYERIKNL